MSDVTLLEYSNSPVLDVVTLNMLKILLCGKKNSKVIKSNDVGKQNTNGMAHSRWVCGMKLPLH